MVGIHEYGQELTKHGRRHLYGDLHTLSLFRCNGCSDIVGYRTYRADAPTIDEAETLPETWVFELDDLETDSYFKDYSSLIYSTHKPNVERSFERPLSVNAPKKIRTEYQEALE